MKNPVFLVSTGRTGTKYFSKFFLDYGRDVASYHTTSFTRLLNVLSNMYYRKLLSRNLMKAIWKRLKYRNITGRSLRYLESNPYYYNLIDIISGFFPEAKFIFVIRAPKSFITSHIKWERQRFRSMLANRAIPFWQPVSYLEQLKGFLNDYHQRVEFYSKVWARKNTAIRDSIKGKDNVITLRFEEVFHPAFGEGVMTGLMKWLQIPLKKAISNEVITEKVNVTKDEKKEQWDEQCAKIMNKYCGSLMREFGYSE